MNAKDKMNKTTMIYKLTQISLDDDSDYQQWIYYNLKKLKQGIEKRKNTKGYKLDVTKWTGRFYDGEFYDGDYAGTLNQETLKSEGY